MNMLEFGKDLTALLKKYNIKEIVPIDSEYPKIEYYPENDTVGVRGFKFSGKFNHEELKEQLDESQATYTQDK